VKRPLAALVPIWLLILAALGAQAQTDVDPNVGRTPGVMAGKVTSNSGTGLSGVKVKIFEEGLLLAETETSVDGDYQLDFDYLPDIDWTLMVWFVPPPGQLIPEIVILRESLKSKDMELWSPCLPRIDLKSRLRYDVTLLNENEKLAQISELDCFRGEQ
jgi:hypothetical protein